MISAEQLLRALDNITKDILGWRLTEQPDINAM
jgi:hypothetical protein